MLLARTLKDLLRYEPDTGCFYWLASGGKASPGKRAGSLSGTGRRYIQIDGRKYQEHRLAYLYVTGEWPEHEVDHINCDPADNRWNNLRPATSVENKANCRARRGNQVGHKGVSYHKGNGSYQVKLTKNGKRHHIGYFKSLEEAKKASDVAASRLNGSFARTA